MFERFKTPQMPAVPAVFLPAYPGGLTFACLLAFG